MLMGLEKVETVGGPSCNRVIIVRRRKFASRHKVTHQFRLWVASPISLYPIFAALAGFPSVLIGGKYPWREGSWLM